jgi:hypothetical protein
MTSNKIKTITYIVYESNKDIIITIPELDKNIRRKFFGKGKRNLDDYNRIETDQQALCINSFVQVERPLSWSGVWAFDN